MDDAMQVFDRRLVRRHRDRAAPRLAEHDFLLREVAERLAERLEDVTRSFPLALDLGCHDGVLQRTLSGRGSVETMVQCDLSPAMAQAARRNGQPALAADEETLPFAEASFDAVFSLLSLHWVNDLPGALVQIRRALKPDGLFLAALLGGETLTELRGALMQAEIEEEGGAGPRVSPFADVAQAGGLLQRAGFALPVADVDSITVSYPDAFRLMQDLRGMGETNAVAAHRRTASRRATLMRAAALYGERHADQDGRLPATFQVVYLTAWAPHESQPQPLRPGSAKARLADALETEEQSAGEKADPGGQSWPNYTNDQ
ncbi:MAG: methyltransferase domain-containing protein [Kiloniellales bacterium]